MRRRSDRAVGVAAVKALDAHLLPRIILKIGRQTPTDASQAVTLLQEYGPEEPVALQIWRHGRSFLVEFDLNAPLLPDVEVAPDSR